MPNTINSSSRYHSDSNSGFTLIELMVTIVVLAVIVSIAAPSISTQLANQRVKTTTATLMNVLKEARAESNINNIPMTVSYDNGNQSNNFINVEAPYSGPLVFASSAIMTDWTNIFFKSALARQDPPKKPGGNNGGTTGGGTTGGGTTGGGTTGGGTTGGGTTGGGTTGGGTTGGGTTGGGTTGGGTTDGGTTDGGTTDGGTTGGGTTDGGTTDGGTTDGGTTDGGTTDGGTTDGGTTGNTELNLVIVATYQYDKKVIIKSSPEKVTFRPNKIVDKAIVYTICDNNKSVSPRQVSVSKVGLISSKLGGTCE